jgi:hypothetical protein
VVSTSILRSNCETIRSHHITAYIILPSKSSSKNWRDLCSNLRLVNPAPLRPRYPRTLNLGHLASPNWLWCIQAITQNQARSSLIEPRTRTYRGFWWGFLHPNHPPRVNPKRSTWLGEAGSNGAGLTGMRGLSNYVGSYQDKGSR